MHGPEYPSGSEELYRATTPNCYACPPFNTDNTTDLDILKVCGGILKSEASKLERIERYVYVQKLKFVDEYFEWICRQLQGEGGPNAVHTGQTSPPSNDHKIRAMFVPTCSHLGARDNCHGFRDRPNFDHPTNFMID